MWPLILPFLGSGDLRQGAEVDFPAYHATYTWLYIIGIVFAFVPQAPRRIAEDEHAILYYSRRTNFGGTMVWVSVVTILLIVLPVYSTGLRKGTWSQIIAADPLIIPLVGLGLFLLYESSKALLRPGRLEVTVFRNGVSYFDSLNHGGATLEQWVPIERVRSVRYSREEVILTIKDSLSIKIRRACLESQDLGSALQSANPRIKITDDLA